MKRQLSQVSVRDDEGESRSRAFTGSIPRNRRGSSASSRTLSPDPWPMPPNEHRSTTSSGSQLQGQSQGRPPLDREPLDRDRNSRTIVPATEQKRRQRQYAGAGPNKRACVSGDESSRNVIDLEEPAVQIPQPDPNKDEIIDVDELEAEFESELFGERPVGDHQHNFQDNQSRNTPYALPWASITRCTWGKYTLRAGKTVETIEGSFFQITSVIQNCQTDAVHLLGLRLKRARELNGMLPKKVNEVCFIYEVDLNDPRSAREQNTVEFELDKVVKIRKLICTNRPFPECRLTFDDVPFTSKPDGSTDYRAMKIWVEENEVLVARWKYISIYTSAVERLNVAKRQINFVQQKLEYLTDKECCSNFSYPAYLQRESWRGDPVSERLGEKVREPFAEDGNSAPLVIDLTGDIASLGFKEKARGDENRRWTVKEVRNPKQSLGTATSGDRGSRCEPTVPLGRATKAAVRCYTYGDAFCGAGGMTQGAISAGLKVIWGFDFNPNASETWRYNFPRSRFYEIWAHEFATLDDPTRGLVVDILHLSPPCQVFSPVHPGHGKNDEMNFASLFAVQALLEKSRPRMVTLEQTFGILHEKFKTAFHALVRMFTEHGFSVCWQVCKLQDWGLAQSRRRLIILAAGPGETLPELPAYTHAENGGGYHHLKCYTTVRSVLSAIPRVAPNHDISGAIDPTRNFVPWDDSKIATCITTAGLDAAGKNKGRGHPSGERRMTHREFAALQSFPLQHEFRGQGILKQIGNSVPPMISKIILTTIRKHLEENDKAEMEARRAKLYREMALLA